MVKQTQSRLDQENGFWTILARPIGPTHIESVINFLYEIVPQLLAITQR